MVTPLPSPPPLTPGWYVRMRREADGRDVEELALLLPTDPPVPCGTRVEYIRAVEAGVQPVTVDFAFALQREVRSFRVDVLFSLVSFAHGWIDAEHLPPICAACGFVPRGIEKAVCLDCGAVQK